MPDSRLKTDEKGRRWIGIAAAFAVLLAGAVWALVAADHGGGTGKNGPPNGMTEDMAALWDWVDPLLVRGAAGGIWSLRWDVRLKPGEAGHLPDRLGLSPLDEKGGDRGTLTKRSKAAYGGTLTLLLPSHGRVEQPEDAVILFERRAGERDGLLAAAAEIGRLLAETAFEQTASFRVRGETDSPQAAERLAAWADARLEERYEDGGTVSLTYRTRQLHASVPLGRGRTANLQIALHTDRTDGTISLVAGVPLITGDYAASD
jgi:hypothetical protein